MCIDTSGKKDWQRIIDSQKTSLQLKQGEEGKLKMASKTNPKAIKKPAVISPDYSIQIVDYLSDLTIEIDDTNFLYRARIGLFLMDFPEEDNSEIEKSQEGAHVLSNLDGKGKLIEPTRVTNSKHVSQWLFTDLDYGTYQVSMIQAGKPLDCFNLIDVEFTVTESLSERLKKSYAAHNYSTMQTHFSSKIEDQQGVLKVPLTLPIDLNSYRFMAGGKHEQNYILISDLFALNEDSDQNVIKI